MCNRVVDARGRTQIRVHLARWSSNGGKPSVSHSFSRCYTGDRADHNKLSVYAQNTAQFVRKRKVCCDLLYHQYSTGKTSARRLASRHSNSISQGVHESGSAPLHRRPGCTFGGGSVERALMPDTPPLSPVSSLPLSFDGPLGQKIIELHVWAVGEGLRGTGAAPLFDGFCQRLVGAGMPLWRAFAGMKTLHPQWGGYGYTWWRRLNAIQPQQFERGDEYEQGILESPIGSLVRLGEARAATASGEAAEPWLHLRRRLTGPDAQLDFPSLKELAAAGATDYFVEIVRF